MCFASHLIHHGLLRVFGNRRIVFWRPHILGWISHFGAMRHTQNSGTEELVHIQSWNHKNWDHLFLGSVWIWKGVWYCMVLWCSMPFIRVLSPNLLGKSRFFRCSQQHFSWECQFYNLIISMWNLVESACFMGNSHHVSWLKHGEDYEIWERGSWLRRFEKHVDFQSHEPWV
jgi:hypothetical protein